MFCSYGKKEISENDDVVSGQREQGVRVGGEREEAGSVPQEPVTQEVKNSQVVDKMEISEPDETAQQNPRRTCRDNKRQQMFPDNWEESLFDLL